jgi:predicted house-cleaning noncanonical NTP pyrophosphatase (MazG superfamily)
MSGPLDPYGTPVPGDSGIPGSLERVLADVAAERAAQDASWEVQDFPDGTGHEYAEAADAAKRECRTAWAAARLSWRHILAEEFYEALAETDMDPLRTELVQTAAVAVKWVQALDRRDGHLAHRTKNGPGRLEKLVRDRIPDLMRAAGERPDVRVADDGEYTTLLRAKLYEEVGEFAASGDPDELADILEVVAAIAATHGLGWEDLHRLCDAKAARNGGFERRHVLRRPGGFGRPDPSAPARDDESGTRPAVPVSSRRRSP